MIYDDICPDWVGSQIGSLDLAWFVWVCLGLPVERMWAVVKAGAWI